MRIFYTAHRRHAQANLFRVAQHSKGVVSFLALTMLAKTVITPYRAAVDSQALRYSR